MIRKWFIRKVARLSGKFIRKSELATNKGNYKKAFSYLKCSEKLGALVGSPPSPITTTQRLELNFLTHNYDYLLENIEIPINAIEKTKLDWSQADRNYLKVYNYNFILLYYILLDDGDKILETFNHLNAISYKGMSAKMIGYYPPYSKERLKKLFESEPYYAENYSEEIIGNVYEISEHLWKK